jgi:carbamoyltransferase
VKLKRPIIVGINRTQDASISVFEGNEHFTSIQKERLTGVKHDWGRIGDLALYKRHLPILQDEIEMVVECFSSDTEFEKDLQYREEIEKVLTCAPSFKRITISHHLSHIYSAFPPSAYKSAAGLVVDFQGSWTKNIDEEFPGSGNVNGLEVASFYNCTEGTIKCFFKHIWNGDRAHPEGLGVFYNFLSKCFYEGDGKEGKVMGLAPYGDPSKMRLPDLYVNGGNVTIPSEWNEIFNSELYKFTNHLTTFQEKADLAAIGQLKFQKALLQIAKWLKGETKQKNLCYVGGCALNVTANTQLKKDSTFKQVFIPPAPHDGGTSIGCATYGLLNFFSIQPTFTWNSDYLGPKQSVNDAKDLVQEYPNIELKEPENIAVECSSLLASGKIVAIFQDKSEFGPRALGNRSILADPRYEIMKFWINQMIKGREWYRPIAPIVLDCDADEYFEIAEPTPFMLYTAKIKDIYKEKLKAVCHIDGTARVQTINQRENPLMFEILKNFKSKVGIGMLCNTSFNLKGRTIVETPLQAIEAFSQKPFHSLIMPPFVLEKKQPPSNPLLSSDLPFND